MRTDTIAEVLTRIRNAQRAGHRGVRVPSSNQARRLLEVLKSEGFIENFETRTIEGKSFQEIEVGLKYYSTGEPVIRDAKRVSSPGRRMYTRSRALPRVQSGLGLAVVSTSQGVMSDREARKRKIGGEVIALIG